jgi:hypothetical protein
MESIAETPVSRRMVLKTAGSQAMQSMLPIGDIAKALDVPVPTGVAGALSQATRAAVPTSFVEAAIPGLVAKGIKEGIEYSDDMVDFIRDALGGKALRVPEESIEHAFRSMSDPYARDISGMVANPAPLKDLWLEMTGLADVSNRPALGLTKQSMRSVKQANPEVYEAMKNFIRDASAASLEGLAARGERIPFNVRSDIGRYKAGE